LSWNVKLFRYLGDPAGMGDIPRSYDGYPLFCGPEGEMLGIQIPGCRPGEVGMDAFLKFDDFDEIPRAYLKKEKGLFIQNIESELNEKEIQEVEEKLKKLI